MKRLTRIPCIALALAALSFLVLAAQELPKPPATKTAAEIKLSQGIWPGSVRVVVTVDASGNVTVTPDPTSPVTITGGGGTVVVPPPPPSPSSLTSAVKAATAAVPEYAGKADHRRGMAFGMGFIAQAVANTPVDVARKTVRQFCDSAVGADAEKWKPFWVTVDAKLDSLSLTPAAYTAALGEMAAALTADLPAGADGPDEIMGVPTYGLSPELKKMLVDMLIKFILQMLGM